jgi:hypothetical protein
MEIKENILKEIKQYCELNNIDDIGTFINKIILTGFNIEKYGSSPIQIKPTQEKIVEKEVPVEVIKEVIVEKIITLDNNKELIDRYDKLLSEYELLKTKIDNQKTQKNPFPEPPTNRLKNIINWVSKNERNDDTWGEG